MEVPLYVCQHLNMELQVSQEQETVKDKLYFEQISIFLIFLGLIEVDNHNL